MSTNPTCAAVDEGCDRPVTARGLCGKHYLREYRAGKHTARPTRAERAPKECPPDHPHDVDTCWSEHGCRCATCVHERAMERQRRRNRLRAYGRADQIGPEVVDAVPARAHVQVLHDLGLGYERIAQAAGIGHGTMMDLIYGRRGTDSATPITVMRKTDADALLALSATDIEAAFVDPTGTVRRLRALVAIGWTETALAESLGMTVGNFWEILHGRRIRVTPRTRDKTTALFQQRWQQPLHGPRADRARKMAAHYRWAGPLEWDDIDDPAEAPDGLATARKRRASAGEYLDDVAFLLELGESPHQAAALVGRSVGTVAKAAERHHRENIRAIFEQALNKRIAA